MPIIDPAGLFGGKRLRRCSDQARLRWPYYFLASNGYARLELDPETVLTEAFLDFKQPVSVDTFWADMEDYRDNFLLFTYDDDLGRVWGQWDCQVKWLSKYKTKADTESPAPPEAEFQKWRKEYQQLRDVPETFRNFRKINPNSPLGNGVGEGVGVGVGGGVVATQPQTPPPLTAEEWLQPDPDQVAQQIASECIPNHWFPSDHRMSATNLRLELVTAANLDAHVAAIRKNHERWCIQVDQARQTGSLPRSIAHKAFEWWIKDRLYLQEPKFGATRLEQAVNSNKPGASRTVARLLASGREKNA